MTNYWIEGYFVRFFNDKFLICHERDLLIPKSAVIANDQDNKKLYLKKHYVEAKKREFLRLGKPRDLAFINSLNKPMEPVGYYDQNTALP